MTDKKPISLIIDDSAPRVFVYKTHALTPFTKDGRPLADDVPNSLLDGFCDMVERYGVKGKFSVVPMPGGFGSIADHVQGFPDSEIREWVETVKTRLTPYFDLCPEMITHAGYVDLATGKVNEEWESKWSFRQTRKELTPYIARALEILKSVGITATGVTSPWNFGEENEDEYVAAISAAMDSVLGKKDCWYFCAVHYNHPWLEMNKDGHRVVSIPGTIGDAIWQAMDTTDVSEEYVNRLADDYITEDGKSGTILKVLDVEGGIPILTVHWQSVFSNGAFTGLRVLNKVCDRVNRVLCDRVEWKSFSELMNMVLENEKVFG